jgi:L-aminopeptidase/D-esterase-like protein
MRSEMIVNRASGSIVDVPGLRVGHFTMTEGLTGNNKAHFYKAGSVIHQMAGHHGLEQRMPF